MDPTIIQIYAVTKATVEKFYEQLESFTKMIKMNEITIIMGEFNVKFSKGKVNNVGRFRLDERNYQFSQVQNVLLSITLFELAPCRIFTWKSLLTHTTIL